MALILKLNIGLHTGECCTVQLLLLDGLQHSWHKADVQNTLQRQQQSLAMRAHACNICMHMHVILVPVIMLTGVICQECQQDFQRTDVVHS